MQTHYQILLLTAITLLSWLLIGNRNYVSFDTYFMLGADESVSVPGDMVIGECMILRWRIICMLVLSGCKNL